uniref:Transmembrane protein n=1 Tax=Globisporangium ultimum (strain ATCC 200006 / CBS 805.95 / DAOM BR144) TaxID=431595 RepID=K3X114_GLOUD
MKWWWSSQLLPALHLVALLFFYTLDVRDLLFKISWLGPPDTFVFDAVSSSTISAEPLIPAINTSSFVPGEEYPLAELDPQISASPWLSFYEKCQQLHAGDKVFDTFVGKNCRLGTFGSFYEASDVIFTASVRVDSIAWVSCKMLYLHRRPPVCQETIVSDFSRRYHLQDLDIRADQMAQINSNAEYELLRMLDMLSRVDRHEKAVCTEGFQFGGPGQYSPYLFTCASPNFYESATVGYHAATFGEVHDGLSWLAVDKVRLMGLEYVVRQNSRSRFLVQVETDRPVTITQLSAVNFSSFGHLYVLMVLIDVALFGAHLRSFMEASSVLGIPVLGTWNADHGFSWTLLYHSLYRSDIVLSLTILSGTLSWITMIPNATLSDWTVNSGGQNHAFFTSMRAWMLVVSILNVSWSCFVALSEARAYRFAKATFVSVQEVIMIVAGVCFLERDVVFDLAMKKHKLESQRTWDTDAFKGRTAFYNTYNGALDDGTPRIAMQVIYDPLIVIVLESIVVVGLCLAIKYAFYGMQTSHKPSVAADFRVTEVQVIESMDDLDFTPLPALRETPSPNALHMNASYSRLPLEDVLKMPIRANSIVRNSFELDKVVAGQKYIPPHVYLDFGLIMKDGLVRTRRGFRNMIRPKLELAHYVCPVHAASTDSGSPSKSAIASMKATTVIQAIR